MYLYFLYLYLLYLEGNNGGACLCWCVPIPCVAQQMKQLSGDNFSPPHPATLQKLQKDKKFKNYWRTKKIQNKLRIQSKNKSDMWRVHLIVLSVVEFLLHCLSCMIDFSYKHFYNVWLQGYFNCDSVWLMLWCGNFLDKCHLEKLSQRRW